MPIYEYRCQKCGEKFEKLLRSCACQDKVRCPECDSEEVEKAVSLFGVGGPRMGSSGGGSCAPTGG